MYMFLCTLPLSGTRDKKSGNLLKTQGSEKSKVKKKKSTAFLYFLLFFTLFLPTSVFLLLIMSQCSVSYILFCAFFVVDRYRDHYYCRGHTGSYICLLFCLFNILYYGSIGWFFFFNVPKYFFSFILIVTAFLWT